MDGAATPLLIACLCNKGVNDERSTTPGEVAEGFSRAFWKIIFS
jgi:hypothetical protein